jgi:transposase
VRSALEWAEVRAMDADGVSGREIARRLGISRNTVAKLLAVGEPPRYCRASAGSMLDPLEPVLRRLIEDWPEIKAPRVAEILREDYGYGGSVDLVRKRLALLRPRPVRPAQRTGYRPGQVLQVDWGEMPTRPKIAGRERRVYALVATLPYSGAQTAHFSFDLTAESFLEGHVRIFDWLGGVVRECVYDNLRSAVARRERDQISWNPRFLALRGHYAFHATACTPATPREKGSVEGGVRHLKTGFWPARRFGSLAELDEQYARWRDRVCNQRTHATGRFAVGERLAHEREVLRPLPPTAFEFAGARPVRVPLDGYLKLGGNFYRAPLSLVHQRVELRFDRDRVWIVDRGERVGLYARSYEQGQWFPPPRLRPEPPTAAPAPQLIAAATIAPPELADYAQLCA